MFSRNSHKLARLIHHEIDHLDGLLYTARMTPGTEPIPVEAYRQTGRAWVYDGA
ncbi:peptide deformylase [Streptomyces sp. NPDC101150]|uniref:peptide deformylase n=1 Tax=Streptomyces sp. NPDC101150 TaxID=3366114 RepID=UPI00380F1934